MFLSTIFLQFQDAFVKLGQTLKLESVLRGEVAPSHPTTNANQTRDSGNVWDPNCIFPDFKHEVVCGDAWNNTHLFIGTADHGTFLIVHNRPPVSVEFVGGKLSNLLNKLSNLL